MCMIYYFQRTAIALLLLAIPLSAQAPKAGLDYLQNITVPNWTTAGANQANFDLFAFNPLNHSMYVADRTNGGVFAIDTHSNEFVGSWAVPGNPLTNGVLVAPDVQQLVVTDAKADVFVYNLRIPQSSPDKYVVPNITAGTDALTYNPLNRTVYVINGSAPYYITGIDLAYRKVASQMALPGSPELNAFNPVDGLIYQVITDGDNNNLGAGVVVYDPYANKLKASYLTPNCVPHGIDIDPIANVALLGCGTNQPQVLMNLKDGTILQRFPDVTGTDLLVFNPNTRRFYVGAGVNVSTTTGCPQDTTQAFPIVAVIEATGPTGSVGRLDGVQCSGRNGHGLGVDPVQGYIYVGSRQYPADPASATSGVPGVLVFYDPAPAAQPLTIRTVTTLAGINGSGVQGTAKTYITGRVVRMDVSAQSISGTLALLNVTTTAGNEGVPCGKASGSTVVCNGTLVGDPMIGGSILLSMDGVPVAGGIIATAQ
jgi:hypothetical protein